MSQKLAEQLDRVRLQYINAMKVEGSTEPYLTAHRIAHQMLMPTPEEMADIIMNDPKLLAARAADLIEDPLEIENPCVGAIVYSNLFAAALEGLLAVAVNHDWLEVDSEGQILVSAEELDRVPSVKYPDFSESQINLSHTQSILGKLFGEAESDFVEQLNSAPHNAYQLALQVSSDHTIFAPEELAPLLQENPLLLGLRADDLVDEDMFEGDLPAGIIISVHLTEMLLQQLLEIAQAEGALAFDSVGEMIVPDDDEDNPTVH